MSQANDILPELFHFTILYTINRKLSRITCWQTVASMIMIRSNNWCYTWHMCQIIANYLWKLFIVRFSLCLGYIFLFLWSSENVSRQHKRVDMNTPCVFDPISNFFGKNKTVPSRIWEFAWNYFHQSKFGYDSNKY